jgi:hypothetical protein
VLSPTSFRKIVTAATCEIQVLASVVSVYAELAPAEVLVDPCYREDQRALLESVVDVLSFSADAPISAAFLCLLLHVAVTIEASAKT